MAEIDDGGQIQLIPGFVSGFGLFGVDLSGTGCFFSCMKILFLFQNNSLSVYR